ncbi:hypothetical protein DER44DRAFT_770231, partial [Fusarium oxysporum]
MRSTLRLTSTPGCLPSPTPVNKNATQPPLQAPNDKFQSQASPSRSAYLLLPIQSDALNPYSAIGLLAAPPRVKMAVYHSPEGRKFFVPLENNPQVFTNLAHDLGMDPKLAFHDVYSLDEPDLLAMVPRPAHALIFITPSNAYHAVEAEDVAAGKRTPAPPDRKTYSMEGFDDLYPTDGVPPVLWFPQTIGNACGMVALVHALLNGSLRERLLPSSSLAGLLDKALALPLPTQRADLLYNSAVLEEAHSKAAARGDTVAPNAEDPIGYHFMAFVKGMDGNLWGLDGSFGGMMCYGPVSEGEDMLRSKVLDIGVRRFINAGEGSAEFSIIALSERED